MTILPLTYLGSIEWFARLVGGGCVIDIGENWVKQTARNRAEILTANGVVSLTVPVHGGSVHGHLNSRGGGSAHGGNSGANIPVRDIRIDNSKRWQHIHWMSIVSAYRGSPFFDHYEERFAPVYAKKFDFLTDLNLELLSILLRALRLPTEVKISEHYTVPSPNDVDLRGKKALRRGIDPACGTICDSVRDSIGGIDFKEYVQVFSDRTPFVPGLSVVDLLFCEGPSAREFLLP